MALAHGRLSLQRRPPRAAGREWLDRALPRERLPYTWKDAIEKESLKFKELERVLTRHRVYPMSKYRKSRAIFSGHALTLHKINFAPLKVRGNACHPRDAMRRCHRSWCTGASRRRFALANARPKWQSQPLNRVIGWMPV